MSFIYLKSIMEIETIIEEFKKWNHVKKCGTMNGAFNQCDLISKVFISDAKKAGFDAKLIRMSCNNGFFSKPHKKWQKLAHNAWVHYAVKIEGIGIVDFTLRQFESSAEFPQIYAKPLDIGYTKFSYEEC